MAEFLVLTFTISVAPLVILAVLESNAKRKDGSVSTMRLRKSGPIVSPIPRPAKRAEMRNRFVTNEGQSRSRARDWAYRGTWEDGSSLSDFVTDQIRRFTLPN